MFRSAFGSAFTSAIQTPFGASQWLRTTFLSATSLTSQATFSRSSGAAAFTSGGVLQSFAADTPRFAFDQSTTTGGPLVANLLPNPRGIGVTLNVTATDTVTASSYLPTSWGLTNTCQLTVTGQGTEDGLPCTDIKLFSAANVTVAVELAGSADISATAGEKLTMLSYVRPLNSFSNSTVQHGYNGSALTYVESLTFKAGTLKDNRTAMVATLTGTGTTRPRLRISIGAGETVWLRVGAPGVFLQGTDPGFTPLPPVGQMGISGNLKPVGLLVEGQRTNGIRNPRAEGITTGTNVGSSALPTNWWMPNHTSGCQLDVSPVSYAGLSGVRIRFYGTVTAPNGNETIEFDSRSAVSTAANQSRAHSFYYRLGAGTWPAGLTFNTRTIAGNNNPSFSLVVNDASPLTVPDATLRRAERIVTMPGTLTSGATVIHGAHMTQWTQNTTVDFSLDLFCPQSESDANFVSSPVLNGVGSLAASTRAEDVLRITRDKFADKDLLKGTIVVKWKDLSSSVQSVSRNIFALSSGSTANRLQGYIDPNATTVNARVTSSGANSFTTRCDGFKPGQDNIYAFTWGDTRAAHCINGNAVASTNTAVIPDLSTLTDGLRLMTGVAGASTNSGIVQSVIFYPGRVMSDAELKSATK